MFITDTIDIGWILRLGENALKIGLHVRVKTGVK